MYKLHKTHQGFVLTSDEKIKLTDTCLNIAHGILVKPTDENWANSNASNLKKVINREPNIVFSALKQEEQRRIGWFDVEQLAKEEHAFNHKSIKEVDFRVGVHVGFQKAQELSDKVFTREDMFKLLDLMRHVAKTSSNLAVMEVEGRRLIESLSQQSWSVELQMEWVTEGDEEHDEGGTLPESVTSYQQPKRIGGKIKLLKLCP